MNTFFTNLGVDIPHLFVMFLLFSFTGWLCEEFYCCTLQRKLVKRGMLFGPICPIYGFGGVIISYCLFPWKDSWLKLFFSAMVLTTILEYFSSWLLEKMFHTKWWDYSKLPFNIHGRVCLLNSVLFGLLGIVQEHYLEPFVYKIVYFEPIQNWFHYIHLGLALLLATDICFTIYRLIDFTSTLQKFKLYSEQLKERFAEEEWFKSDSMHSMISSIKAKSILDSKKFSTSFMDTLNKYNEKQKNIETILRKFPTLTSKDYSNALEHIKLTIKEKISKNIEENIKLLNNQKKQLEKIQEEAKAKINSKLNKKK